MGQQQTSVLITSVVGGFHFHLVNGNGLSFEGTAKEWREMWERIHTLQRADVIELTKLG